MSREIKFRRILTHKRKVRSAVWLSVMILVVIWMIAYLTRIAN